MPVHRESPYSLEYGNGKPVLCVCCELNCGIAIPKPRATIQKAFAIFVTKKCRMTVTYHKILKVKFKF